MDWATSPRRRTSATSSRPNWASSRRRSRGWSNWSPTAACRPRWPARPSTACSRPAQDVDTVVAERGLKVVSDTGALEAAADAAIAANPDVAEKVRGGKLPAVGALVGAVMKATRGQADAAAVRAILLRKLGVEE